MIFISVVVGPVGALWSVGGGARAREYELKPLFLSRVRWWTSSAARKKSNEIRVETISTVVQTTKMVCVFRTIIFFTFGCFNLVISLELRKHCSGLLGFLGKEVKHNNPFTSLQKFGLRTYNLHRTIRRIWLVQTYKTPRDLSTVYCGAKRVTEK